MGCEFEVASQRRRFKMKKDQNISKSIKGNAFLLLVARQGRLVRRSIITREGFIRPAELPQPMMPVASSPRMHKLTGDRPHDPLSDNVRGLRL